MARRIKGITPEPAPVEPVLQTSAKRDPLDDLRLISRALHAAGVNRPTLRTAADLVDKVVFEEEHPIAVEPIGPSGPVGLVGPPLTGARRRLGTDILDYASGTIATLPANDEATVRAVERELQAAAQQRVHDERRRRQSMGHYLPGEIIPTWYIDEYYAHPYAGHVVVAQDTPFTISYSERNPEARYYVRATRNLLYEVRYRQQAHRSDVWVIQIVNFVTSLPASPTRQSNSYEG